MFLKYIHQSEAVDLTKESIKQNLRPILFKKNLYMFGLIKLQFCSLSKRKQKTNLRVLCVALALIVCVKT